MNHEDHLPKRVNRKNSLYPLRKDGPPEQGRTDLQNKEGRTSRTRKDGPPEHPVGLVEFCFDTSTTSNEVTLTFVTDLTLSQVVARKFNDVTGTYFDIAGATITETTLSGEHALQVVYTIEDNGPLDLDPDVGEVRDPIGLALAETSSVPAPGTVSGTLPVTGASGSTGLAYIAVVLLASGCVFVFLTRTIRQSRTLQQR